MKYFLIDPYLYHFRFHFRAYPGDLLSAEPIPFHELVFVLKDTIECRYGEETFTAETGYCIYLPPGSPRHLVLPTGSRTAIVNFFLYNDELALPRLTRLRNMEQIIFFLNTFNFLWTLHPDDRVTLQEYFHLIISETRRSASNLPYSRRVETAKAYIGDHLAENLTVEHLSDLLGLTPDYFGQLFRRHEDCSVREYITTLRMRKAMSLLQEQTLPIKEIAEQVGFHDPFYFMNVFKKNVGVPPATYRKNFRCANVFNLEPLDEEYMDELRSIDPTVG